MAAPIVVYPPDEDGGRRAAPDARFPAAPTARAICWNFSAAPASIPTT
ncbi:hypothetical protein G3260_002559 [Streptomyces albus]|nr:MULTISPECIES: hypothetical protein [Streptomyces]QID36397.1 hypothetical protein G3260_002559 [Streptomyces albus]